MGGQCSCFDECDGSDLRKVRIDLKKFNADLKRSSPQLGITEKQEIWNKFENIKKRVNSLRPNHRRDLQEAWRQCVDRMQQLGVSHTQEHKSDNSKPKHKKSRSMASEAEPMEVDEDKSSDCEQLSESRKEHGKKRTTEDHDSNKSEPPLIDFEHNIDNKTENHQNTFDSGRNEVRSQAHQFYQKGEYSSSPGTEVRINVDHNNLSETDQNYPPSPHYSALPTHSSEKAESKDTIPVELKQLRGGYQPYSTNSTTNENSITKILSQPNWRTGEFNSSGSKKYPGEFQNLNLRDRHEFSPAEDRPMENLHRAIITQQPRRSTNVVQNYPSNETRNENITTKVPPRSGSPVTTETSIPTGNYSGESQVSKTKTAYEINLTEDRLTGGRRQDDNRLGDIKRFSQKKLSDREDEGISVSAKERRIRRDSESSSSSKSSSFGSDLKNDHYHESTEYNPRPQVRGRARLNNLRRLEPPSTRGYPESSRNGKHHNYSPPLGNRRESPDHSPQNIPKTNDYSNQGQFYSSSYHTENERTKPPTQHLEHQFEDTTQKPEDEPLKILDVHEYFRDDFDLNSLDDLEFEERIEKINTYAQTFESKVNEFNEEKYSIEHFVLDEKLMRLIEKLDKIRCQNDRELTKRKVEVIEYIKNLHVILDERAKDET